MGIGVSEPVGQQQWMQECVHATLTPPFDLREAELDLWALGGDLDTLRVEVFANDGAAGPGTLLGERPLDRHHRRRDHPHRQLVHPGHDRGAVVEPPRYRGP